MKPFFTIPFLLLGIVLCFWLSYGHMVDLSQNTRQALIFPASLLALLFGIEYGAWQDEKDSKKRKNKKEDK